MPSELRNESFVVYFFGNLSGFMKWSGEVIGGPSVRDI